MRVTRRSFLAAAALGGIGLAGAGLFRAARSERAGAAFDGQPLAVPPLLDARAHGGSIELTVREASTPFFKGVASRTLGYNGSYLGPTLRMHSGDDVSITVDNRMGSPTTVHWHGLVVPGELDGGPHQEIAPGGTWRPRLPVRQPAATLFYHSHLHLATAEQVYFGLAGMLIVADEAERELGLPSEYGVDDLPLVLQDRSFVDGRMVLPSGMMDLMQGRRGDTLLVNGTVEPVARVPARRVRLRLVNGSNARIYDLAFGDRRVFHWIASEGGLLDAPVEPHSLPLTPGQRAEILVDFSDGAPVVLATGASPQPADDGDDDPPWRRPGERVPRAPAGERIRSQAREGPPARRAGKAGVAKDRLLREARTPWDHVRAHVRSARGEDPGECADRRLDRGLSRRDEPFAIRESELAGSPGQAGCDDDVREWTLEALQALCGNDERLEDYAGDAVHRRIFRRIEHVHGDGSLSAEGECRFDGKGTHERAVGVATPADLDRRDDSGQGGRGEDRTRGVARGEDAGLARLELRRYRGEPDREPFDASLPEMRLQEAPQLASLDEAHGGAGICNPGECPVVELPELQHGQRPFHLRH
jgi:FtsP/CotA-like multicopper oxidase with cupredoxin domain